MNILVVTQKVDARDNILGFFHTWLNALAKKIDKIYVLALESRNVNLADNIDLYSLARENGGNRLARLVKFNRYLAKIIFHKKTEMIFIHMCPEYAICAFPYARIMNVPMVMWHAHGQTSIKLRLAHLLVDKVITPSRDSFRIHSRKVVITGHGIEVDKFQCLERKAIENNGQRIILSVGRLSPIKNYEMLIRSADVLVNQRNIRDLKFKIVGAAPKKNQKRYLHFLKNTVRNYQLEGYFQFVGPVAYTEIQDYYRNCDLFVSTSNTGSLDKAVLEAMASGKIILTSNQAFKDMLDGYSQELMIDKEDTLELADKMVCFLGLDMESQNKIGLDLRSIVEEKHNLCGLINRLASIFYSLAEDKD